MRFLILVAGLSLISCNSADKADEVTIGNYSINIPTSYRVDEQKVFNGDAGEIQTAGFTLIYHHSNHTRPPVLTVQEYLDSRTWQADVARFLSEKKGVKETLQIQLSSVRAAAKADSTLGGGCDYVAVCQYDSLIIEAPIYLPLATKESQFLIDTFDNHYRKIYLSKTPKTGKSGVYIKPLHPESLQSHIVNSLSIETTNITKGQQDSLVAIFLSSRVASK